jgi:hypothetical protein
MSTQRRENRWQRRNCTERARAPGVPGDRVSPLGWEASDHSSSSPIARQDCAYANGGTAPPQIAAWLATNSLQSDYRIVQLVQLFQLFQLVQLVHFVQLVQFVPQDIRHGSPPGAERRAVACTQTTHGSSLPRVPLPSGFSGFHPTLPRVPAGRSRRAEGYDGKRDLHLQHAA